MHLIDIPEFINRFITKRQKSLFIDDLEVHCDLLTSAIQGKSVLVIGGAGTIGSSFIKTLLEFKPDRLYVVDTNENGLTELTRDLRSTFQQYIPEDYKTYPMDFSTPVFQKMFKQEGPFEIVANFAAHKHVRSEKDHYSIEAMLENNVFKAKELLDLLSEYKPEHFFCVSTDKAANPVNVMGASKKLMEETIMAYSKKLKITTARFANVAFSNGSLLDGYLQRLYKKQPVSCPSDVKRFFVSPVESGQICLLACILGKSGEIFFPKLYEHDLQSFKDITLHFFNESGITLKICHSEEEAKSMSYQHLQEEIQPIYFFDSETSGEKLYEEFYSDEDQVDLDYYQGIGVIKNAKKPDLKDINDCIMALQTLMTEKNYQKEHIIQLLQRFLPQFNHVETGKNLDQKM